MFGKQVNWNCMVCPICKKSSISLIKRRQVWWMWMCWIKFHHFNAIYDSCRCSGLALSIAIIGCTQPTRTLIGFPSILIKTISIINQMLSHAFSLKLCHLILRIIYETYNRKEINSLKFLLESKETICWCKKIWITRKT